MKYKLGDWVSTGQYATGRGTSGEVVEILARPGSVQYQLLTRDKDSFFVMEDEIEKVHIVPALAPLSEKPRGMVPMAPNDYDEDRKVQTVPLSKERVRELLEEGRQNVKEMRRQARQAEYRSSPEGRIENLENRVAELETLLERLRFSF